MQVLSKRFLKPNLLAYNGPPLKIKDLTETGELKVMLKMSQTVNSEQDTDKKCKNYPNDHFETYNDCDSSFIYKDCKDRFPFMPFGVANDLKEITIKPR